MSRKILIVDDEPDALELIAYNLKQGGFNVVTAKDGGEALEKVKSTSPDLIILDVMLPEMDGFALCRVFKGAPVTACIPIIMLTAKAAEIDRVLGLELGADDYVTKPFSPRELVLRVKKLLERTHGGSSAEQYRFGKLTVDVSRHIVTADRKKVELTATEFKLLVYLIEARGAVRTREQMLKEVWDYEKYVDTRTVDTHMRRLREKLGVAAEYIETTRGVGYRFVAE
ncbi:MAG: two component transcriptional regulator, winged helix family [Verrucomicrobiales bacterium]|nr:two component transcriptional regulator, winged helix family [Verrucomicrobiales bacterium]